MSGPTTAAELATSTADVAALWRDLVTAALLGTDRRDPPDTLGPVGDLVADTARVSVSERMLAQVAAVTAVRRAAVLPGPPVPALAGPRPDDRRPCVPAAVDRWHHITTSWPVLEDEWMLVLVRDGWRLADELTPPALRRHRTDPIRHARVRAAAGPLADWLIDQLPDLACSRPGTVDPEAIGELPDLPIPAELLDLVTAPGASIGEALRAGLEAGDLGQAHRNVLVNLVARIDPDRLGALADALGAVDPMSFGAGHASVLADLATTRHRMLDELSTH